MVDAMQSQTRVDPVGLGDGGTLLGQVVRQAVDASFGEMLAACLARVRVPIAVVRQLRSTLEVLGQQRIRAAPLELN